MLSSFARLTTSLPSVQLHFTRHLSLNHNANRRRLRNRGTETVEENGNKDSYKQSFRRCGYVDERRQDHGRRDWSALRTQSKLGRFLRRCCSTPSAGKTEPERQRSKAIGKRNKLCWAICR
ncbi:hypothetical protein BHE74_00008197 [Ensete ventricosum]|nr:hypothetical protein GW17_00010699 [Ensete ventricosum]RWW83300.1 hypothetical protein BHE74_00008197 [Ensete ventricosum]RZS25877.1 hypothetical protein BHM03_00059139 [Ensete ventricosum]